MARYRPDRITWPALCATNFSQSRLQRQHIVYLCLYNPRPWVSDPPSWTVQSSQLCMFSISIQEPVINGVTWTLQGDGVPGYQLSQIVDFCPADMDGAMSHPTRTSPSHLILVILLSKTPSSNPHLIVTSSSTNFSFTLW